MNGDVLGNPSRRGSLFSLLVAGGLALLQLVPAAGAENEQRPDSPKLDAETVERLRAIQLRPEGGGYRLSVQPAPTAVSPLRFQLKAVARTELAICAHAGACGSGPWVQEVRVESGTPGTRRKLRWTSTASGAIEGQWQVSTQPFSEGPGLQVSSLLKQGKAGSLVSGAGEFEIDFGALPAAPTSGKASLRPAAPKLMALSEVARTFYVRVLASQEGRAVGPPSPSVVVRIGPRLPAFDFRPPTVLEMKVDAGAPGNVVHNWIGDDREIHVPRSGDTTRWFHWAAASSAAYEGVWQVSREPFPAHLAMGPAGVPSAGSAGAVGTRRVQIKNLWYRGWRDFPIDIAALESASAPPAAAEFSRRDLSHSMELRRSDFTTASRLQRAPMPAQWKEWFLSETYYVRVVPVAQGVPVGAPSNAIRIRFGGAPAPPDSQYRISTPPDIFDLDFEFSPVKRATLGWGCIQIRSVDPALHALLDQPLIGESIAALIQASRSGAPVCPEPYERPWYYSFWDFVSGVVDRISQAFSAVKNAVVSVLADALPGDLCNSTCRDALMMGLNAGLVALGIPPEIPNLSQLTEEGMDYLVEMAVAEAPVGCGQPCRDAVRAGLERFTEETRRAAVQSYQDEELAHSLGFEPIWVPPGVDAVPHPDSGDRPGKLTVRITRRSQPVTIDQALMRRYVLDLRFSCKNEAIIGRDVSIPFCCQQYGSDCFECGGAVLRIQRPIEGDLFTPISLPIPPLQPGQEIVMPMILDPEDYWIPERLAEIRRVGGLVKYNDWQKLYEGGVLTITASIQDGMCPASTRHEHVIGVPIERTVQLMNIR